MKLSQAIILILASVVITIAVEFFFFVPNGTTFASTSTHKETAYERVMRTGVLRCGYVVYGSMVMKDPNTGKLSGFMVDLMQEIGNLLSIKIEWAEEIGWATTVEGLRTGRYDVVCSAFWRESLEAKHVFYSLPFSYGMVGALVRPDDMRFDNNLDRINQSDVKIVSSDGAYASVIARRDFPKAKLLESPNLTDPGQLMEDVATRKGDIIFVDLVTMNRYLKKNPGRLRPLPGPPMRVFQNTLALPQGDNELKSLLDTAIIEIIDNVVMDKILDKYDPERTQFLRIPKPYEAPQ